VSNHISGERNDLVEDLPLHFEEEPHYSKKVPGKGQRFIFRFGFGSEGLVRQALDSY